MLRAILSFMRISAVLATLCALGVACGSSDPKECNDKGSYAGTDTCTKIKSAFETKCAAQSLKFDCDKYFASTACSTQKRFCSEGVDNAVNSLNAAADCDAAQKLTLRTFCF